MFPVRVGGSSMVPTLAPGDLLAVAARVHPRTGDVVVALRGDLEVVKRVVAVNGDTLRLAGDNRDATTDFDAPRDAVAGVVVARYWPRPKLLHLRPAVAAPNGGLP